MSKMASLFWLVTALLLLALCQIQAPHWFSAPGTVRIVQAGILLGWLLVMRFGFAVQLLPWLRPADRQDDDAERVLGPLCDRHPSPFWQARKKRLPWLLVTGQAALVESLMPGLITERWQVSRRGILLWCGEPGQITGADIAWLRRRRGRRALNAVLWVTDAGEAGRGDDITRHALWQQLKRTGAQLGWRLPVYAVVRRENEHDQYDRPLQGTGLCWTPGTSVDISARLDGLVPDLVAQGMRQVQHNRRWSWLLQLAQDIRHAALSPLAATLQPLVNVQSGVLLSGVFFMPPPPPGQHAGYRDISLSPAWYALLHQARIRRGQRDRLIFRDWLYRGTLAAIAVWWAGMLTSACLNARLIKENSALLAQTAAGTETAARLRHLRGLQRQTAVLLWRSREGSPLLYRSGLDQNARQLRRLWPVWQQQAQQLMLAPVMAQLTTRLRQYTDLPPGSAARRSQAGETYRDLKTLLMLTQPQRAEPAFLQQTLTPLWPAPDPRIPPGEWMMLSSGMTAFFSHELPRHPDWRQAPDDRLVAAVRTLLRGQKGLRNSENALYQSVLLQAKKHHPALSLSALLDDDAAAGLLVTDQALPGIFTREAWESEVRGLIAKVSAARQVTTDPVLDEAGTAASPVLSEDALRRRLTARYFADYAGAWLGFLNSLRWQQGATLSDTLDQLSLLGDSQRSPLIRLGRMLRRQAGVGQEGRTMGDTLLRSAKQLVAGAGAGTPETPPATAGEDSPESRPAEVVARTFAPLLAILPAEEGQKDSATPPGGLTLQDYLLQVTQVRLLLQQVTTSDDPRGGMLALMQETLHSRDSALSVARTRGSLMAASLGQDWSGFATAAFSEPLEQAWQSILTPAAQALNDAWQQRVVYSWQTAFSGRYPFTAGSGDASLPLLAHFIAPQRGVVEQFISQQLHGLVEKQGDEWVPVAATQQAMTVNPAFLAAVNLLARTGRQAFAQGEARLSFAVQMRPLRGIVETTLQLDDAQLKYFNQQAEWQAFTWPDKQTAHPQAVLSVIPENRNGDAVLPPVTVAAADGPWALLRLLDKARPEQLDSSRWRLSWTDKNGQVISLLLRTESGAGPLDLLALKGFTLPATVFSPAEGADHGQP
ncbi:hypothetical protein NG99_07055 [Erwinia typographi]|uniref:Type VI secretion protein VasK n=1 Tax=Erwinia typographi TaxID=371042 RepID=A0A0A3Z799_9GAMM|nr:ImcF-related family protein [Erwinia typographi]KGT94745.1 hypothetical protein NG99_07055 [Erwinia typographi]